LGKVLHHGCFEHLLTWVSKRSCDPCCQWMAACGQAKFVLSNASSSQPHPSHHSQTCIVPCRVL
jgi:hypothetical protein